MSVQALVNYYEHAPPSVRRRGRSWYPEVRRRLVTIANESDRPLSQAVAVFAITSIDAQLITNLRWTEEVLRGERKAGRYPAHQAPLIEGALQTTKPRRYVRGPKCSAFYRAVMGDTDVVVLDRWAARAAGYPNKHDLDRITTRRELERMYREAAHLCGETVRAFQAIVWIVVRESTPTKRAIVPRLADITG